MAHPCRTNAVPREEQAFVGLGSNLESPQRQLLSALDALAATPGVRRLRCSSFYRSAPVGFVDQPDFCNAVAEIRTTLPPVELLQALLAIERRQRRVRAFRNAPRTLDLDVLIYGDLRMTSEALTVPHPRAHLRAFVLIPLLEIAQDAVFPGLGPARDWLARVQDQGIQRISDQARPGSVVALL
jgi:2-amino-4-hydroxy-6-hydroxymethyldihydropteridine diphosphokinase